MDTLGIDIGTTTVKYVRYRKKADRIISFGEYRYRRGWEELREILSAIKDKEGTNLAVSAGITSVEVLKKICSVPVQPENETRTEVDSLISKGMLVPLVDIRRQYIMLDEIEERGVAKQEVLFLGAHKSFVAHIVSLFHKTGFKRLLLLTDVGFCYQPMTDYAFDGAVAVVDIGGRQTGIYIIDNGKLLMTREVMTACETLKDAVVGGTALSPNEAEEHLWINGFGEISGDILALPLERLAAQIQRTFLVYSQKYPKRPVVAAWVAGKGARIPGLPEKLNELLTEQFDVLPARAEVKQEYIPAYALATRSNKFPNLLNEEITGFAKHAMVTRYAKASGILVVCVIALLSLVAWARLHHLKTAVDSRVSALTEKKLQFSGYNPDQQPMADRPSTVPRQVGQKDASFVLLLKHLSAHLPAEVYLKSIEFDAAGTKSIRTVGDSETKIQPGFERAHRAGAMHLAGYVVNEEGDMETLLMQVMVCLEKSGVLTNIRVARREIKNVRGKMLMEFMVYGECREHEI